MDEALGQFMDEFALTNQAINNTAATLHYRDVLKVKKTHGLGGFCQLHLRSSKHIQQEANERASSGIIQYITGYRFC